MKRNLDKLGGLRNSQRVLLALTQAGASREEAYSLVQRNAMKTVARRASTSSTELKADEDVTAKIRPRRSRPCSTSAITSRASIRSSSACSGLHDPPAHRGACLAWDRDLPLSRLAGYGCAALGAAFFSTKAIFIKLAFQGSGRRGPDACLSHVLRRCRSFVAIGIWAYAKRRAKGEPPPDRRTVAYAAFVGFIGYYVASAFDFAGLQYISASLERLVLFTYPLFVMFIGAALYGERITRFGIASAVVTYIGLACRFHGRPSERRARYGHRNRSRPRRGHLVRLAPDPGQAASSCCSEACCSPASR